METYKCNNCGMSVNASCAKCNQPLVNGHLTLEDGTSVQISSCPTCKGNFAPRDLVFANVFCSAGIF